MASEPKLFRCAIYTRKSTEHGLELEFNSLHAQRDACEAYIKSQASQGWRTLPQHYDDPAYSGGNLDRPALKKLLVDIDAGKVDVIVVYKIDRLTRSLADFAKLVEAFDARSISFVAVTQQFNTTTSMGRLTLNILLSFAQFERELSSERVRDKVAASRRKGKWTGGTVPLGYEARDKKLVVNKVEAETVRTIFKGYLEQKSFSKLITCLDRSGIVTKRRDTDVLKYRGGIPFSYGPLAHVLKNRIYIGEVGHGGKWFKGEHKAIIDRETFDRVQNLLAENVNTNKAKWHQSGAPLKGKLYDERGNRMRPSFSSKMGVRYRFYVNTALLRARKDVAVSVRRVSAPEIELAIETAIRQRIGQSEQPTETKFGFDRIECATLKATRIEVTADLSNDARVTALTTFEIPWVPNAKPDVSGVELIEAGKPDHKLAQAVVRAHVWLRELTDGKHVSIESLARAVDLNPKVIRQALRLAFLAPGTMDSIMQGSQPADLSLRAIPFALPLSWKHQSNALRISPP
jgi:DNA invertase Pin-like site-specific DNA recombinase